MIIVINLSKMVMHLVGNMVLIEINVNPKIVILEGKGVYENLVEVCMEIKNTWDKNSQVGFLNSQELKTSFIGYSRLFSNITSNKEVLAKTIEELLKR
ncbi:MAG: hypothetical protein PSX81_09630 [bacterium]|nr:hypothetical protein [bacterium]